MQVAFVDVGAMSVSVELPTAETPLMDDVRWGLVNAFPTPAFWAYQVIARRLESKTIQYKLGGTLREELGACLLGGHGIPASVGLAAFTHLKGHGAFAGATPDESDLFRWLSEPLKVGPKFVRYRFARQKAAYLARSLERMDREDAPVDNGRALRDWLLACPGIGHKTASWIARNWLDADDVAILDIHILRAGLLAGIFSPLKTVERDYLELEERFLAFSAALGVRASELDAVIWYAMMSSPATVQSLVERLPEEYRSAKFMPSGSRSHKRRSHTTQLSLLG